MLRVERGSSELIASYKEQIQVLNSRITELEQEKSNLNAQLLNLKNEYEVRLSVQNYNSSIDIKKSAVTDIRGSEARSEERSEISRGNLPSPVQRYNINTAGSPKDEGFGIKMVDSKIEPSSTNVKTPTYGGLSESQRSSGSATREQSSYGTTIGQVTSTYQTPSSSVSGGSSIYSSSASGIGAPTTSNVYQASSTQRSTYTSQGQGQSIPTYQATSTSGMYQGGIGSSSGIYQSGTGSGSGVFRSGASGTSSTYQQGSSTYQPYQGYNYRSGTSGTGASETSGTSGATGASGTSGTYGQTSGSGQQYSSSSSYRYTTQK